MADTNTSPKKIKPNVVKLMRSSVAGNAPTADKLEYGQLAINFTDEKLFFKNSSNEVVHFASTTKGSTIRIETDVASAEETEYRIPLFASSDVSNDVLTKVKQSEQTDLTVSIKKETDEEGHEKIVTTLHVPYLEIEKLVADAVKATLVNADDLEVKRLVVTEKLSAMGETDGGEVWTANVELPETTHFNNTNEDDETVVII